LPPEINQEMTMKYTKRFKESVLKKVLPPENRSVSEVAREMGLSYQTIYNWKKMLEKSNLLWMKGL